MSDHANHGDEMDRAEAALPEADRPEAAVESYETDDGVVFYDAQNPLAWLKAGNSVTLADHL